MKARNFLASTLIVLFSLVILLPSSLSIAAPFGNNLTVPVFINEIHYDNTGTDADEAIEVFGPSGTDLTGWSIVLYNGSNGTVYDTDSLSGTIPDQCGGFGTVFLSYPSNGIQNGSPDAIALVDGGSTVIQFLSYEGSFVGVGGPADGLTSTDIGVAENGTEPLGQSLQLVGTGTMYSDFSWSSPSTSSFGSVNTGQTCGGGVTPTPEPTSPPDPTPTPGGAPPEIIINEIDYDQPGTDAAEYIELRNNDVASVDLKRVQLGIGQWEFRRSGVSNDCTPLRSF
ncbi:MAG: lamin tail domain-containing protein [Anaerolineae bacterium]|nr:lamin tail domain-containing protein [Anaerolineae bacterium]